MSPRGNVSATFPDFPWDTLAAAKARGAAHPGGLVDLSIGTPVDPTPDVAREALIAAADAPGYPTVFGPESLRQAAVDWIERRFEVRGLSPSQVLPTIGSKEFIANLPVKRSWMAVRYGLLCASAVLAGVLVAALQNS